MCICLETSTYFYLGKLILVLCTGVIGCWDAVPCELVGGHTRYISHPFSLLYGKRNVAHSYENYKECHGDITDYKGSAGESLGCYLGNLVLALELQCIDMVECWYDVNYQIVGLWYVVCPLEVGVAFLMENVMVEGMLIDE